jgi:membrane associated rhomboid family serine protease
LTETIPGMGLYDRDYHRADPAGGSGLGGLRALSVNTWIIVINVLVFVIQSLTRPKDTQFPSPLEDYGHFSTYELIHRYEVWRLITFQFLHANLGHLFFNMFGLFVFGSMVERHLGRKKYAAFYLVCGIFGGLSYLLLNLGGYLAVNMGIGRIPGFLIEDPRTRLVGASAGVFGIIMACAYIAPNAVVQLIFPPVPLRLKLMAYGYVAIAAFNLIVGGSNAGGDAAHIGGAIAGYFFIRRSHLLGDFFDVLGNSNSPRGARAVRPKRGMFEFARGKAPSSAEVDRILAKVATEGLSSLSEAEKHTLRSATESQRRV